MPADPARVATARQLPAHLGVTLGDLQAEPGPHLPTLAEYLPRVVAAAGTCARRTYGTYWNRMAAAVAALGALLALIAGLGRTSLAMARHRDLPGWLSAVHPRYRVPHHAEVALAVVVSVLVATLDLRGVIGFSSFGVLVHYAIAIANASAFTQPAEDRRWPRGLNCSA
jgi:amino acid transporter